VPSVDTDFRFVDTECSAAAEQRPGRRLYASGGLQPRLFDNPTTVSHCDHEHSDGRINVRASQALNQADRLRS
jgi:hypothetical protein